MSVLPFVYRACSLDSEDKELFLSYRREVVLDYDDEDLPEPFEQSGI